MVIRQQESKPEEPRKDFGFVAVSIGQGMNDIFRELGVDYLIEGGQTMNPSTEDMLNAIEQVNAETVFILPNNKNIILAATQAQSLVEDKKGRISKLEGCGSGTVRPDDAGYPGSESQ